VCTTVRVVCVSGSVNSPVSSNIDVVVNGEPATWDAHVNAVFHYQVNYLIDFIPVPFDYFFIYRQFHLFVTLSQNHSIKVPKDIYLRLT